MTTTATTATMIPRTEMLAVVPELARLEALASDGRRRRRRVRFRVVFAIPGRKRRSGERDTHLYGMSHLAALPSFLFFVSLFVEEVRGREGQRTSNTLTE
jgi:hypothetical protein